MQGEMTRDITQIAVGIPRPRISDSTQHSFRLDDVMAPLMLESCIAMPGPSTEVNLRQTERLLSYTRLSKRNFVGGLWFRRLSLVAGLSLLYNDLHFQEAP